MNFDYLELSENGKTLIDVKDKTINSIIIPDSVTEIDSDAFFGCERLASITIGRNVRSVDFDMFKGCHALKCITFLCTKISGYSIVGNSSVEELTIGEGVSEISTTSFSYFHNLVSIIVDDNNHVFDSRDKCNAIIETKSNKLILACKNTIIPLSVRSIGSKSFSYIKGLNKTGKSNLRIPDSVVKIEESAFIECDIKSIIIPQSVRTIGESAFLGCDSLTSITINGVITEIGDSTFWGCNKLKHIDLPNTLKSIGRWAFMDCAELTTLEIPKSLQSVGLSAFEGCVGLEKIEIVDLKGWCSIDFHDSISNPLYFAHSLCLNGLEIKQLEIPETVYEIKDYSFSGCKGLTIVRIHKNVSKISITAFEGCENLEYLDVDCENLVYSSINGVLYDKKQTKVLRYPPKHKCLEYHIPESVTDIGDYAFSDCPNLESVVLADGVISIGHCAFQGCISLKELKNGHLVTRIGSYTFSGCKSLQYINLPQGIVEIGDGLFEGCESLQTLTIPSSVSRIGEEAFVGCTSLKLRIPESVTEFGCIGQVGVGWESIFEGCKSVSRLLETPEEKEFHSIPYQEDNREDNHSDWISPYSNDYKQLINGGWLAGFDVSDPNSDCRIIDGTEIICECAVLGFNEELDVIHVPASVQYIGMNAFESKSIIIEGRDTFFCKNFWRSGDNGTIYVPCGTSDEYAHRLEGRDYNLWGTKCHFQIVELSKAKITTYLGNQKRALIDMISDKRPFSELSLFTINGEERPCICMKTDNMVFITSKNLDVRHYLSALNALGFTFSELCEILGSPTEHIPIEESLGRRLVKRVFREWEEDFVDEETGEVETITRQEILVGHSFAGQDIIIDTNDIENLKNEGFSTVYVYGTNAPHKYIRYYDSDNDIDLCPYFRDRVIKRLFVTNEKDEHNQRRIANKLAHIYKEFVESDGCIGNIQDVLEIFNEPCHVLTAEENNAISLINEFYDDKIASINNCKTESDVMPLFTTDEETYYQLKRFLQEREVSENIIFSYVTQFFEQLCGRIIDVTDCQQDVSKLS